MSKAQWGHGFHKGTQRGLEDGSLVGGMYVAEHARHCVTAALRSLRDGREDEAAGILSTLQHYLYKAAGFNEDELPVHPKPQTPNMK